MDKNEFKSHLKKIGAALATFAKTNYLMLGYVAAAILIELTAIAVTAGRFYMSSPWLYLTFLALICFISQFLPAHLPRYLLFTVALSANFILDLLCIVLFDSTGQIFDYSMLNLRSDAVTILESIPIDFAYVFISAVIVALYLSLGAIFMKRLPKPSVKKSSVIAASVLLALTVGADAMLVYFPNKNTASGDLTDRLYQSESGTYSKHGVVGNFANELARGTWFMDVDVGDTAELYDFVYAETTEQTPMTGIAAGYNVVTVLCESFEWLTFLPDGDRYPFGYAKLLDGAPFNGDKAKLDAALREMYPNLYKIYEGSSTVVLDNSHSLEKTDISENKTIIGNYPMYEYINYSYPLNSLPYSLPNILKNLYGVESRSYHDGLKNFYNREQHHTNALGFESFTSAEDMNFESDSAALGVKNLDSEMMESCKTEMFPTDRRFNTYITTITQHGQYAYRDSLKSYYDKMDELGVLPLSDSEKENALRYYCAAGMDFDKSLGIMLDYLEEKGLADKTIITLFGDHNAYYQGISNYVKNIYSYSAVNYTELYRVPVMIKVGDLDLGNPFIEKFTCVADIYPTILDLLGIKGFSNLMYGVSAFSDSESILYSRAYDKLFTDKIYFNSLSRILYRAPDVTDAYIDDIAKRSTVLLDKIGHVNRLFAADFFNGKEADFYNKLREVNSVPGAQCLVPSLRVFE